MLKGKNILLGVCGSIASYKSAELVRLFVKAGARVKVILTKDAASFITPLTLSTLSKSPVYSTYYKEDTGEWNNHVELALWADVFLIAPISANTMAKFANGLCDNLLAAVYLSAKCPVFFAPAMDLDMWKHPSTKTNLEKLKAFGNKLINPGTGELASGLSGEGRMAEPDEIFEIIENHFNADLPLKGKNILITAGPTYEPIDPVRFIGNHSSGKMGLALAYSCAEQGADVTLVCGPTQLERAHPSIKRVDVTSASEMFEEAVKYFDKSDICILSAAVADYTPVSVADHKIKKNTDSFDLELEKTKDIAAYLGSIKKKQILVGFALETQNEISNAISKLERKNLDFIVLNSLNDKGAGFQSNENKVTIIKRNKEQLSFDLKSKDAVAADIIDVVKQLI
ncbi:bifunctional phosphopantothenoylcysteine decarboxylase/phosphopantothenate--cysteine ligase CoaBC [Pseudopedobacter sp.]|uniref:bifunctional phosphopantothenoylcysteine decarboxylase/phosphopantothenate--cysteine ligase CoaBC n=1 Tax=Pseudopedobacter sp. TaxID=1936787 RepID=UPI0033419839